MNLSQKILAYGVLGFSLLHLTRDIMQDFHLRTWLATLLGKPNAPSNIYSYVMESILIILSLYALTYKRFKPAMHFSIYILGASFAAWLIYYL